MSPRTPSTIIERKKEGRKERKKERKNQLGVAFSSTA
jgi:hypothetical protein